MNGIHMIQEKTSDKLGWLLVTIRRKIGAWFQFHQQPMTKSALILVDFR
jgi:hypothetical protein